MYSLTILDGLNPVYTNFWRVIERLGMVSLLVFAMYDTSSYPNCTGLFCREIYCRPCLHPNYYTPKCDHYYHPLYIPNEYINQCPLTTIKHYISWHDHIIPWSYHPLWKAACKTSHYWIFLMFLMQIQIISPKKDSANWLVDSGGWPRGRPSLKLPSGNLRVCYWKWPVIVDFHMNGEFP